MENIWASITGAIPVQYLMMALAVVVLAVKYVDIEKIKKVIAFFSPYKYTRYSHCHDEALLSMVDAFKQNDFKRVESSLLGFAADYRSFGLNALGEVEDESIVQRWLQDDAGNDIPQLILAAQTIKRAWETRGVGTIDEVSPEDLKAFKALLKEAHTILDAAKQNSSAFDIDKDIFLLQILKATDLDDRTVIHQTFEHGKSLDAQHIGLHLAYFTAISEKWGGSQQELEHYLNQVPESPALLVQCIQAAYYWDLVKVYDMDDEATEKKIESFIKTIDAQGVPSNNLYRYELYLRLYWLASSQLFDKLEDKYYQLAKLYWDDK